MQRAVDTGQLMGRLLLVLVAVLVLGGAVVGGVVLNRTLLDDDEAAGITEAEHDRLVEACTQEGDAPAACPAYVADLIELAEAEGVGYAELASQMDEDFERAEREEQEREQAAEEAHQEQMERDVDRLFDSLEQEEARKCAERHGGPCSEETRVRDKAAEFDCVNNLAAQRGLPPGQVRGSDLVTCEQALSEGLVPDACRDDPNGVIVVADYGELIETELETVPCSG